MPARLAARSRLTSLEPMVVCRRFCQTWEQCNASRFNELAECDALKLIPRGNLVHFCPPPSFAPRFVPVLPRLDALANVAPRTRAPHRALSSQVVGGMLWAATRGLHTEVLTAK